MAIVRGRSHGTGPGRPTAARQAGVGCLAVLIFAVLTLAFAAVLKLLGATGRWEFGLSVLLVGVVYWPLAWWTFIWYYHEQPRWRPSPWRWRRLGMTAIFVGYLLPLAAAFLIALSAVDFSTTWPAAHGGGKPGTLVLQSEFCRKGNCTWSGRFRSDDGTIVRESVRLRGNSPADARIGERVHARDTGNRSYVFAEFGSNDWWKDILGFALATLYLLGWGFFLFKLIWAWRSTAAGDSRPMRSPAAS
jgi:hypothetical protein